MRTINKLQRFEVLSLNLEEQQKISEYLATCSFLRVWKFENVDLDGLPWRTVNWTIDSVVQSDHVSLANFTWTQLISWDFLNFSFNESYDNVLLGPLNCSLHNMQSTYVIMLYRVICY